MRRLLIGLGVLLALLFTACGSEPTDPDPRPPGFSALIVDVPDSTVFVGATALSNR